MSYISSCVWSWIIRSDPLQRAGAVAFLHQLLAKDVVDVEDPDDEAVGEGRREVDERTNIKERIGGGYEDGTEAGFQALVPVKWVALVSRSLEPFSLPASDLVPISLRFHC